MGKSKELYMQMHNEDIQEYFEWIREEEWQHYVSQMEDEYLKRYGYALMFRMKWAEFKKQNGMA